MLLLQRSFRDHVQSSQASEKSLVKDVSAAAAAGAAAQRACNDVRDAMQQQVTT